MEIFNNLCLQKLFLLNRDKDQISHEHCHMVCSGKSKFGLLNNCFSTT